VQVQVATSVPWSLTALSLHMEIINVDHDWRVVKIISRAGNSCSDLQKVEDHSDGGKI